MAAEQRLDGGGGQLFFRSWTPAKAALGVVVIVPGFNSHSGPYAWAAGQLGDRGLCVYALDLRGRGKSDGERFYVQQFGDYVSDVDSLVHIVKSQQRGLPIFLLGHSAGGVVACLYAIEHQALLAGLVCESFAFEVPAPDIALAVLKGLDRIVPHAHVLRLMNEDFSRDQAVVADMNADPLIANEVQPTKTVAELVRADERLRKEFPLIRLPLLILHGTADRAAKPDGSRLFHELAGSADKTIRLYEGHVHDLLRDLDKERVLEDIAAWITERIPTVPRRSAPTGAPELWAGRQAGS
ncbi:alpha/beta hydrolase [Ramlibacter sp.]